MRLDGEWLIQHWQNLRDDPFDVEGIQRAGPSSQHGFDFK